jgi:hypothetical protein
MILEKIAMIIGYIMIGSVVIMVFIIMPLVVLGRHHAERNARIYEDELKRDIQKLAKKLSHEPSSN